jgi:hypothetical protein
LEDLSPQLQAALPTVCDEWTDIGLCTDPADRPAAEAGIRAAYRVAGMEPPQAVLWLDSPMAGLIAQTILLGADSAADDPISRRVESQIWEQIGDWTRLRVGGPVRATVRNLVVSRVESAIRNLIGDRVRQQVWAEVGSQVQERIGMRVSIPILDAVGGWFSDAIGPREPEWLAGTAVFARLGVDVRCLDGLVAVARNAGWWWAMEGVAVATERPALISRDADGLLHSESGPAVEYRDGFAVHTWHGIRVPADLIDGWSVDRIFAERNTEIRRCAIERLGWPAFVAEAGIRPASATVPDPGNAPYKLALYDLPEHLGDLYPEPVRILLCTNGSPESDGSRRRFGLIVPGHHADPVEAAADLYGIPAHTYRRLQVRR